MVGDANPVGRDRTLKFTISNFAAGVATIPKRTVKHGLLAKRLHFLNDEEKMEFSTLLGELEDDFLPFGRTESALVEEVAACFWKIQTANGWKRRSLRIGAMHRKRFSGLWPKIMTETGFRCLTSVMVRPQPLGSAGSARSSLFELAREIPSWKASVTPETKTARSAMYKSRPS